MAERSRFWTGTTTGDATEAPYDAPNELAEVLRSIVGAAGLSTSRSGVIMHRGNSLLPAASASPVSVQEGEALVHGTWYQLDAPASIAVASPAVSTRNDVLVVRKDWTAQTVRLTVVQGVEGGGVPAIEATAGDKWDMEIARWTITTGGVITLTDRRAFIAEYSSRPLVVMSRSSTQNVPTGALTAVIFETVLYESPEDADMWDVGDPTKLVAPFPGVYRVSAAVASVAGGAGTNAELRITKNGTTDIVQAAAAVNSIYNTSLVCVRDVPLARGDYVQTFYTQNSGGDKDIYITEYSPVMSMEWLRSRY